MKPVRIYLTGMTHAGKTTTGTILADMLGWKFIDVDAHIAAEAGMSVQRIFKQSGERAFRRMEYDSICRADDDHTVLATGAGAPVNRDLMDVMLRSGFVVFIDVPIGLLVSRVLDGAGDRPLLQGLSRSSLEERLSAMYKDRIDAYSRAHLTIAGGEDSGEVASGILEAMRR